MQCSLERNPWVGTIQPGFRLLFGLLAWQLLSGSLAAAPLSDPEVDAFNVRVGTQTFSPRYQFTTNTVLVETAEAMRGMGSDIIKFYLGPGFSGQYPGSSLPASVTNLTRLAKDEPSCRRVLDMPFRHLVLWSYCFAASRDAWWDDGFSVTERQKEYNEIYGFTAYLLTNYNNSGKSFYLGHWEGDWYLLQGFNTTINPTATATQGMIDWLNLRQQAVDDARRDVPHTNVSVFHYTEVNRVRDAMVNPPESNQRVVNAVLPAVTNLDFVSWSSYDGMNLGTNDLDATLDYLNAHLATNKTATIPGRRVFIGEYGWGGTDSSAAQELPTRNYLQKLLPWSPRFILFWQMYDNENKAYWLIDSTNSKTPCYFLHQRFINRARLRVAQFKETNLRLPSDAEFANLVTPLLNQPLAAVDSVSVANGSLIGLSATTATLTGTLCPNTYGDDAAAARIYWGLLDGGTNRASWSQSLALGLSPNFNPTLFTAQLTSLVAGTNYLFRFYATNSAGEFWAPNSGTFSTVILDTNAFGSRLKVTFPGYTRNEALPDFPVLILLGTNLPGFRYQQFASLSGADLRFTDRTGTRPIPHEIDEWNPNGVSSVWVQLPALAATNDCLWACWGNPAATNAASPIAGSNVWSQHFELVWHLKQSSFPFADSVAKHPAASGGLPQSTTGLIGRGILFNGVSAYLNAGAVNPGNAFTLSAWVNLDPAANSIQTLWANKSGGSVTDGLALFVNSWQTKDAKLIFETGNGSAGDIAVTPTSLVTTSQWHHVAAVVNRSNGTARLFVDGTDHTDLSGARMDFASQSNLLLGRFTDGLYSFRGKLDEARVETVARPANWVWASWMTVASNATFSSYSTVTQQSPALAAAAAGGQIMLRWPGSGVGFAVHTATNLTPPVTWTVHTNPTVLTNGFWQTTVLPSGNRERFFRLQSF